MIKFQAPGVDFHVDPQKAQELIDAIRSNAMGGWFDLPETYDRQELAEIQAAAAKIQTDSEYLVCIGIGGSYLGHRALIEALRPVSRTKILYAGNSLSSVALQDVLDTIGDADFSINVISKSGTTTEPAVAFRILKSKLEAKYGAEEASGRIYATTDASRGALHDEAESRQYTRFVVPDDIGGRYSVLSAVGLLPLAVAGVDVKQLLAGAAIERQAALALKSSAIDYGFARAQLQRKNYDVEVLATFEPHFQYFTEWWKQLFGESEGKNHQGIFPAATVYTTDLHSLGQYLQEGRRNIFETMLEFENVSDDNSLKVPELADSLDGLDYLEGRSLDHLNHVAMQATIDAHRSGGIPVLEITAPGQDARSLGALVFYFELACAISAQLSGVNPFDQPGVEAYKTNMFKLLGKPGF